MALPEKITAWKDATERFGAWHETQAGQGASGDERFYIRADLVDELVKALEAQIRSHAMLCRAAGLTDQAHALGTSQARAALTRIKEK